MPLDNPDNVASAGVTSQSNLDKLLFKSLEAARANTDVTCAGVAIGMVKPLEGKVMIAKAREVEGAIATAARLAAELHIQQTKACVAAGADTGTLTTVGGVELGPQPMGGGR